MNAVEKKQQTLIILDVDNSTTTGSLYYWPLESGGRPKSIWWRVKYAIRKWRRR